MLSVSSGHDVGYLTGAVGAGREGYYTDATAAGEPAGVWHGAGAAELGLSGEIDTEQMVVVYHHLLDPRDPASASRTTWGEAATLGKPHKQYRSAKDIYAASLDGEPHAGPERREELRAAAERAARQPVSFLDVTFSAPKSLSVLGAAFERAANDARAAGDTRAAEAWETQARAVEEAVMAGARAGVDYLERNAGFARTGHHGGRAGRWIDAPKWVVGQFLQHDSRNGDPQWHVHNPILNRALGSDGVWRALDGAAIFRLRGAAGVIADRVAEAYAARVFGPQWETTPDGRAREIVSVDADARELFSSRSHDLSRKAAKLAAAYTERFGRSPSALVRTRLQQQATLATRKAKSHDGETIGGRLDRWNRECREATRAGLARIAHEVMALRQQAPPPDRWSEADVIERGLAGVAASKQSWSRWDLARYVTDALPANLGIDPADVPDLVAGLTDKALQRAVRLNPETPDETVPAHLRRADGTPVYVNPTGAVYATPGQLAADHALRGAAVRRTPDRLADAGVDRAGARFAASGAQLGVDQAEAVRGVCTSGADVESLTAAAGAGKSFTVGAVAATWTSSGRRVFGLATSQIATQVLSDEGVTARNVAAWLTTQARLDTTGPGQADPDEAWRLRGGDLVVVDEAGMVDTPDLAAVHARCEQAGAKLLLTGDPRQLAAVGAGGALADVAEHGIRYELTEVRRFDAAWERAASLQLRDGDPAALDAYQRHGRLVDGGTAEQAEHAAARAWLGDTLANRESLLLVGSNTQAARVSAALRDDLVTVGRVAETGVELGRDGWRGVVAGVGDLVQARRNGWDLIGFDGNTAAPINRGAYRVTGLRADGGLTVAPVLGKGDDGEQLGAPMHLPASYVAADVTLGYASTVHAAQGRTVDTAHAVLDPGADAASGYVAMTRGRDRNTAYAVTTAVADGAEAGEAHDAADRSARAVLTDVFERDDDAPDDRSSLATAEAAEQEAVSIAAPLDRLAAENAEAVAGRTGALLDRLAAEGAISDAQREALAADEAYGSLEQVLRTAEVAGRDPRRVLADAVGEQSLDSARWPARVLHSRISAQLRRDPDEVVSSFADLIPRTMTDEQRQRLQTLADVADDRRRELGADTAELGPQWAVEALGPVPDDPVARAEWEHSAGWAAAHREAAGHTDEADALGDRPPAGLAEQRATWAAAHAALNLPDGGGDEHDLTDGQLRVRVRAFEHEEAWAPRWVGDELAATHQAEQRARTDAQVWAARTAVAEDEAQREQLRADAATAEREAAEHAERAAALEVVDEARGRWYAETAATRDAAWCARGALRSRGVDLDDPDDRVTAVEWLAADRAAQAAEDPHREITHEAQLVDGEPDAAAAADHRQPVTEPGAVTGSESTATDEPSTAEPEPVADDHSPVAVTTEPEPAAETEVPDIRDVSTPDVTEHDDTAPRREVPTVERTTADVARAQAALAEIGARREADSAREAHETDQAQQQARREELTRWADQDRAAETAAVADDAMADDDGAMVLER